MGNSAQDHTEDDKLHERVAKFSAECDAGGRRCEFPITGQCRLIICSGRGDDRPEAVGGAVGIC